MNVKVLQDALAHVAELEAKLEALTTDVALANAAFEAANRRRKEEKIRRRMVEQVLGRACFYADQERSSPLWYRDALSLGVKPEIAYPVRRSLFDLREWVERVLDAARIAPHEPSDGGDRRKPENQTIRDRVDDAMAFAMTYPEQDDQARATLADIEDAVADEWKRLAKTRGVRTEDVTNVNGMSAEECIEAGYEAAKREDDRRPAASD